MLVCTWDRCNTDGMVISFIMVSWVGWEQLREMVWYGAGIRKLGDGDRIPRLPALVQSFLGIFFCDLLLF